MIIDVNAYLGHYPFRRLRANGAEELIELMSTAIRDISGAEVMPLSAASGDGLEGVLDRLITEIGPDHASVPADDEGEDAIEWSPV